jgi:hypothetical protein
VKKTKLSTVTGVAPCTTPGDVVIVEYILNDIVVVERIAESENLYTVPVKRLVEDFKVIALRAGVITNTERLHRLLGGY